MQREPEEAENEIVKNYNKRIQMALEMESKRLRDEVERGSEMLSSQLNNLRVSGCLVKWGGKVDTQ